MKILITAFCILASSSATAETFAISIDHAGNDDAGKRLAYLFKNSVAQSNLLHIKKKSDRNALFAYLVTNESNSRTGTVYSITWTFSFNNQMPPTYFTSGVGQCPSHSVNECAMRLTAEAEHWIQKVTSN